MCILLRKQHHVLFENDTAEFARNLILPPERLISYSQAKYLHLHFQILLAISIVVGVLVVSLFVLSLLKRVTVKMFKCQQKQNVAKNDFYKRRSGLALIFEVPQG